MTKSNKWTRAVELLEKYEAAGPNDTRVLAVGKRILDGQIFDTDEETFAAIYYLTDEDYEEARSAILFFAAKLA